MLLNCDLNSLLTCMELLKKKLILQKKCKYSVVMLKNIQKQ